MEEEFVSNQERLKPQEERNEEDRSKARSSHFAPEVLKIFLRYSVCPKKFPSAAGDECTHAGGRAEGISHERGQSRRDH